MPEKRLFPRITCEFPVYDHSYNYIGKSVNICFGGLQIESSSQVFQRLNVERTIHFPLKNCEELVEATVVPLRVENKGTDLLVIGFSFRELPPKSEELVCHYIINSLWEKSVMPSGGEGGIQERRWSKLTDKEEILEIFAVIAKTGTVFYCFQDESETVLPLTFLKVEQGNLFFQSDAKSLYAQLHDDSATYLAVNLGFSGYILSTDKHTVKGNTIILPLPEILYCCNRRTEKRENVNDQNMFVSIPIPYPPGTNLHRKVIDVSNKGLAFFNPLKEIYFLPGTPIGNFKVRGKREFVTKAEIRHITPIENGGNVSGLKVGVFFPEKTASFLTGQVKKPTSGAVTRFAKTGSDVFKDVMHLMRGFAVQGMYLTRKGMSVGARRKSMLSPRVDIIRIKNKSNEEIVGILNTTWEGEEKRSSNVLIIPPAFGRRKESTGPLAFALIENFKRMGEDLVIIRYDGINNLGESYKEPAYRQAGREAVGMTLSQACKDLSSVVSYARNNDRFTLNKLVLLTFSVASVPVRRLLAQNALGDVSLWIVGMGVPGLQEVLKNIAGGIDYIDNLAKKKYCGEVNIMGVTVDQSVFCTDVLENKMASMDDAIAEMKQISTPVNWIVGENDAWIESSQVELLLHAHKEGKGNVHMLKMGHVPLNGFDAIRLFRTILDILCDSLLQKKITPVFPMPGQIEDVRIREWDRTPRYPLVNPENYWAGYLMGEEEEDDGYDALTVCEDYINFLECEYRALDIGKDHKVADIGCGTGNFGEIVVKYSLNANKPLPDLTLVDFVPEAMEKARTKYQALLGEKSKNFITCHLCDLEINRLIPVKQFLEGQFFSLDKLKCKINGLYDDTIELWKCHYSDMLHQILRGRPLGNVETQYLKETFSTEEINFIKDMNLAARFLTGNVCDEDFYQTEESIKGEVTTNMLKFHALDFGNSGLNFSLPFTDNQFDRILSSLVLSYLKNPDVTFAEFVRCLKPGGRLVISSMKPDTDLSTIYLKLLQTVSQSDKYPEEKKSRLLNSIRKLGNSVGFLLTLVEECQFRFFSKEELLNFAHSNNLKEVELIESYGKPPQAFILSGVK
ncbi:MAG: methyltransferase domain-containing protein [Candidatus Brocadiaceae bacterium]|nr:methyltransferase domain-containing protein [Candidatus Brocadiaceae bacterium]